MSRRIPRFAIGALVVAAFVVSGLSLFGTTQAASGRCICPLIYAPVKCSNGKTYPNPCVAACHNAKDCVPTGEI